ncbi:MAG: phosphoenolpyruvate kinase, partial [Pseudomonadales bacterium]|nr:phosphoenolpyruvate kinase [Pseudomonadales bacterium]
MSTSLSQTELEPLMQRLESANATFDERYPGIQLDRQPVHTVYGGAHLYRTGAAQKLADLASRHLATYAPDFVTLARALEFEGHEALPLNPDEIAALAAEKAAEDAVHDDAWVAHAVYSRLRAKLEAEAIEDQRVDFEDGYGSRSDDEEDGHAVSVAKAMADGLKEGSLPPFIGIRIKALTEEAKRRAIRTLDLFLTTLTAETGGRLPEPFMITLPKVTSPEQVATLADCLDLLEAKCGIATGTIRIELMIETIQSVFNPGGECGINALVEAGRGRVSSAILGTYDYTATCNIASTWQDHRHPSADFARQMMQVSLTGTEVTLCDGITNVMPIAPHRAGNDTLSSDQTRENFRVVHDAWKVHFDNIIHSLKLGFYQSWDLNPAQLPVRFAAVYYFFLTGLEEATARLRTFIDQAAQTSMVGNTFDDAASCQGLLN